jgi:hypothetical protein
MNQASGNQRTRKGSPMKASKSLERSARGHTKAKHAEATVILDADAALNARLEASALKLFDDPDLFDDESDDEAQQLVQEMVGHVWH